MDMKNIPSYKPAIIVVAFNRPNSLERILASLNKAEFQINDIPLIISIDKGDNDNVLQIANEFKWLNGTKQVIYQSKNLGLKQHILQCGDLSEKYGSVIILEDDLYVSPYFYEYVQQALEFYKNDDRISQISLYNHPINNNTTYSFQPLEENSDGFFMQFASSWGEAWSYSQWKRFKIWLEANDLSVSQKDNIPDFVINWKETSWLKYFIKYNAETERFTLFPKVSLASNFSDVGTHAAIDNIFVYQQPLLLERKLYNFKVLNESIAVYDAYFELHEKAVKKLLPQYSNLTMDLYGDKHLYKIHTKYIASIKKCKKSLKSYAMSMKPHEVNIFNDIGGDQISIGISSDFEESLPGRVTNIRFRYYWTHALNYADMFQLFLFRIHHKYINFKKKIKSILQ